MEERLGNTRSTGLSRNALKALGMLFLVGGIIGRSVLQNQILGLGSVSTAELLAAMQAQESTMIVATVALILQALETCAAPIYAFLLTEGFRHTSDWKKYFLRVLGVAVISELPWNLAMGGKLLDTGSRNPVFALALGLIMLYLFSRFADKKLYCVIATLAAFAWAWMLRVEQGVPMLLLTLVLWLLREKPLYRGFVGVAAAVLCTAISPFYLASPMSFLLLHFYNGQAEEQRSLVNYLFYPTALLVIGLLALYIL